MKVKDPVCEMTIEQTNAAASIQHQGRTYYFCSVECRGAFTGRPEEFVKKG